jgi:hypothetical protein
MRPRCRAFSSPTSAHERWRVSLTYFLSLPLRAGMPCDTLTALVRLPAPESGALQVHNNVSPILAQTFTLVFDVFSAKRFPGVPGK